MSSYARLIESVRRTRKTLYLVAGLYVAVGFVVAATTAVEGNFLGTFLGFLMISGALSVGIIARTALHVLVRIASIEESLEDFSERIEGLIPLVQNQSSNVGSVGSVARSVQPMPTLDLSRIGIGDPEVLAAATLDRDVYPRLVSSIEEATEDATGFSNGHGSSAAREPERATVEPASSPANGHSVTTKNLLHQWKSAMADSDLKKCRQVLSALVDLVEPDAAAPLRTQIDELENRIEHTLRDQFSRQVRSREFSAALETGGRLCELLPDRPVAAEFQRLRPILSRRADAALVPIQS